VTIQAAIVDNGAASMPPLLVTGAAGRVGADVARQQGDLEVFVNGWISVCVRSRPRT
jgi:hypothetical protein